MTLGLDIWNGNPTQLALFQNVTETSFPLLLRASEVGKQFKSSIDILAVINQEGRVLWQGHVSQTDRVRTMLAELLAPKAPVIVPDVSVVRFGTLSAGTSATGKLTISNDGDADLIVRDIAPTGSRVAVRPESFTLAPGQARQVTITILAGTIESPGRLDIFTNDPANGRLTIPMEARWLDATPADPRANFNRSGRVDFEDFLEFANAFGTADSRFDIDQNGRVEFADFVVFASSFGKLID